MAKIDTPFYLEIAEHIYITYLETRGDIVSLKTHFPCFNTYHTAEAVEPSKGKMYS